jgi:Domain of unknown function (DUF4407)
VITPFRNPLLWLACTDHDALVLCPRRERFKQATLGGFVLSSSMLAAVGTFGTARELKVALSLAVVAALFAGLLIMNFDRHVVAALKRQDRAWKTLLNASPRLLFALAAGQVITMVLLIFLFSGTISARVATDRQRALNRAQALLDTQKTSINSLVSKQNALESELTDVSPGKVLETDPEYQMLLHQMQELQGKADAARSATLCELDGTCGTRHAGAGPDYVEKKKVSDHLNAQVAVLTAKLERLSHSLLAQEKSSKSTRDAYDRTRITELRREIQQARKRVSAQEKTLIGVTRRYDGPLARWDALNELAHDHASMKSFKFWLWMSLLLLDTSPALMKTMQLLGRVGTYEQAVEELERRAVDHFDDDRLEAEFDKTIAAEARDRRKQAQREIVEYEATKTVETAKHRIDLAAATEQEANRRLDEGQRARNHRDIEEWDKWLEPIAEKMNEHRFEEWVQELESQERTTGESLWADPATGGNFVAVVRGLFNNGSRQTN